MGVLPILESIVPVYVCKYLNLILDLLPKGVPLVLGGLTRDYTETPCAGDVISLTCTVPGALLEWDVPDPTRDLRLDSITELPFQRDQYTVTFIMFNSTSSAITSSLSFPAVEGITISCLPVLQPELREELTILTASEIICMQSKFCKT